MSKQITDKVVRNLSNNLPFSEILERSVSRRAVMRGGLSLALASMVGFGLTACGGDDDTNPAPGEGGGEHPLTLGFESLMPSMTDACAVPAGYTAPVVGAG